jgi:phage terminase small subunit
MKTSTAPSHLHPLTQSWWVSVVTRWDLDPHHVRLLTLAAEAWDRCVQARELISRDGLLLDGGSRAHPAVRIELDSRVSFSRLIRELDLDLEPPAESKRPPSLRSITR